MVVIECPYPSCTWSSEDLKTETIVMKHVELHIEAIHKKNEPKKPENKSKEKIKRPTLNEDIQEEDWRFFILRWERYKKTTELKEEEVVQQLMDCCSEDLQKDHF